MDVPTLLALGKLWKSNGPFFIILVLAAVLLYTAITGGFRLNLEVGNGLKDQVSASVRAKQ